MAKNKVIRAMNMGSLEFSEDENTGKVRPAISIITEGHQKVVNDRITIGASYSMTLPVEPKCAKWIKRVKPYRMDIQNWNWDLILNENGEVMKIEPVFVRTQRNPDGLQVEEQDTNMQEFVEGVSEFLVTEAGNLTYLRSTGRALDSFIDPNKVIGTAIKSYYGAGNLKKAKAGDLIPGPSVFGDVKEPGRFEVKSFDKDTNVLSVYNVMI